MTLSLKWPTVRARHDATFDGAVHQLVDSADDTVPGGAKVAHAGPVDNAGLEPVYSHRFPIASEAVGALA